MRHDYVHAQDLVRAQCGIGRGGAELLAAWEAFVQQVEGGYEWDVSEYRNELRVRDDLQTIASSADLTQFPQHELFLLALRELDDRFLAVAHPVWQFPGADTWWRMVVPKIAGEELAHFCLRAYGFQLDVVA